jgi:hypothetical protein
MGNRKFFLPWFVENFIGALPIILFFFIQTSARQDSTNLTCRCIGGGEDRFSCLNQQLILQENQTIFRGYCDYSVPSPDSEIYLSTIILFCLGLLSHYIVGAPKSSNSMANKPIPLLVKIVAVLAAILLVIAVARYMLFATGQLASGNPIIPWAMLTCAILCSAVFKWSVEGQ